MQTQKLTLLLASILTASTVTSYGTVYFENTGTRTGWSNYPQTPQQIGRIYETTSPRWGSSGTALAFEQTWNNNLTGYHSEVVQHNCQQNGQDRYYGQVLRFPSNWVFHDKNITWQQYSPEDPSGPWRLVWIQGNNLWTQSYQGGNQNFLQGVTANRWYRIVSRLKLASSGGAYEIWVDGTKRLSQVNLNQTVPGTWIRWSVGIYVTWWRTQVPPTDQRQFTIYQDQFRIASSYAEAEPNNWGNLPTFNGNYRIMARHSGKAVVVQGASTADGADVIQYTYGGSNANDEWTITDIGGGYSKILNRHSGKALVVESASTADGADVIQWTYGGSNTNDEWKIESVGSGYYRIINRNSGKVLNVSGASTADGANVDQWSWANVNQQQFQIISVP